MTDKLHFDDLTKITCPFGMLDDDTRKRLLEWEHGWEFFSFVDWRDHYTNCPTLPGTTYRAKPITIEIPWDVLRQEIQWVAYDDASGWWGFDGDPEYDGHGLVLRGAVFSLNCLDLPTHHKPEIAKFKRPEASK
jgi:hypothetical protein